MKIVVIGFAGAALSISLVEELGEDAPAPQLVWFDDFIPIIGHMLEDNDIDEIVFFGQKDYIVGLANLTEQNFKDVEITIMIDKETEDNA